MTEEQKKNISINISIALLSPEINKRLRESVSGEKNGFYGKHHSDETKLKLREAKKGKPSYASKKVICTETKIVYNSAKEASSITGANYENICSCCRGTRKTSGKLHWQYAEAA